MRILEDVKLDFSDVLILPKRSTLASRKEVDLCRTYKFKHSQQSWTGIPIMAANMDGVGTFDVATALAKHKLFTCLVKSYVCKDFDYNFDPTQIQNHVAVSTGTSQHDFNNLVDILEKHPAIKFICIDIANGYSEHFGDFVSKVREQYPTKTIIAGNVVTADMTQELILCGADIIKVGIGSGAVCTTRIQTGVGYPQLSAVIECADAAHGLGAHVISDGGCTGPGDVAKAFGAGADFVMLGGLLAGHDEGGGEIMEEMYELDLLQSGSYANDFEVRKFVKFYGMSSNSAQEKHGGIKTYRASEGRTVKVPYRGKIANTIEEILGGVRSTCTYSGAKTLKDLPKCTTFIRVNNTHNRTYESATIGK